MIALMAWLDRQVGSTWALVLTEVACALLLVLAGAIFARAVR